MTLTPSMASGGELEKTHQTELSKIISCCWCGCLSLAALPGKTYCLPCHLNCFRECLRCKRPFPKESYFLHDECLCNSCFFQKQKQKQSYLKRKQMEKCVLKHLQNLETLDPDSLVASALESETHPVKPHRRQSQKKKNY